ncbi:hypothetical protein PVAP13_6KG102235 [Panicum virgatum]|uniref:Uncharacterized protein n=1 Tax=Panicum virgatum TaxID=38727 RepID=A0A8T0R9B5_PANVG|nr:hypothetical protein PVAP13_6KG102235 [Panicum virgatum]
MDGDAARRARINIPREGGPGAAGRWWWRVGPTRERWKEGEVWRPVWVRRWTRPAAPPPPRVLAAARGVGLRRAVAPSRVESTTLTPPHASAWLLTPSSSTSGPDFLFHRPGTIPRRCGGGCRHDTGACRGLETPPRTCLPGRAERAAAASLGCSLASRGLEVGRASRWQ